MNHFDGYGLFVTRRDGSPLYFRGQAAGRSVEPVTATNDPMPAGVA